MLTDSLQSYLSEFKFIIPELILGIGIISMICLDLVLYKNHRTLKTAFGLFIILLSASALMYFEHSANPIFYKALNPNRASIFFRILADLMMFIVLVFWNSSESKNKNTETTEYPFLWLSVLFAAHILCISNNWLMVFLSIEMLSISSYIVLGIGFRKSNIEAAFKYLIFGALSTGIMVFGISLIMADVQNIYFSGYQFSYSGAFQELDLLSIGLLMAFAGIFFKLSLFPFHFWVPDVYQGSSLPYMLMVSSIPKIAAFGFFSCQFLIIWPLLDFETGNFSTLIAILGIMSIIWGNLSALRQNNLARLFAYSGIAQSGFMILALVNGYEGLLNLEIFLSLYVFMNIIVFITAGKIDKNVSELSVKDFSGFGKVNVFLSLAMLISMIALTGLPPTGGFTAKFIILSSLFEWYSNTDQNLRLLIFVLAVVNVVISLFFYMKIPYYMYFKSEEVHTKRLGKVNLVLVFASALFLLISFFFFSKFKELLMHLGGDII